MGDREDIEAHRVNVAAFDSDEGQIIGVETIMILCSDISLQQNSYQSIDEIL